MIIGSGHDSAYVGTAVHSVLAASFGSAGPLSCDEISALLKRYRVEGCADCEEIRTFVAALCGWINNRWPSAVVSAEVPVRTRMVDGRIMSGQIDLLLQTESGAIIIDYKSGHLPPDPANEKIQRYAGQLKAYSSALQGAAEVKAYQIGRAHV